MCVLGTTICMCATSSKVQILTQKALSRSRCGSALSVPPFSQITCFGSTKVQILTQKPEHRLLRHIEQWCELLFMCPHTTTTLYASSFYCLCVLNAHSTIYVCWMLIPAVNRTFQLLTARAICSWRTPPGVRLTAGMWGLLRRSPHIPAVNRNIPAVNRSGHINLEDSCGVCTCISTCISVFSCYCMCVLALLFMYFAHAGRHMQVDTCRAAAGLHSTTACVSVHSTTASFRCIRWRMLTNADACTLLLHVCRCTLLVHVCPCTTVSACSRSHTSC
jgi:hypothetical protein